MTSADLGSAASILMAVRILGVAITVSEGRASKESTPSWGVLLLGGAANVGKSTTARSLAVRCGASVLPADAIWYALKAATDPMSHPELHYFDPPDSEWRRFGPEYWCDRHIVSAQAIGLAMNPVIEYCLSERWPVILEGAWITPADAARWTRQHDGLRAVFMDQREDLRTYLLSRPDRVTEHRGETFWLFSNWLREQALLDGLPVVDVHPRASLADRVLAAAQ